MWTVPRFDGTPEDQMAGRPRDGLDGLTLLYVHAGFVCALLMLCRPSCVGRVEYTHVKCHGSSADCTEDSVNTHVAGKRLLLRAISLVYALLSFTFDSLASRLGLAGV